MMAPLSRAMLDALSIAQANASRVVYAGSNYHCGRILRINGKTIEGLKWRGLATDTEDDACACVLTTAGLRLFPDASWEDDNGE